MITKINFECYENKMKNEGQMELSEHNLFKLKYFPIFNYICKKEQLKSISEKPTYNYIASTSKDIHFLFLITKETYLVLIIKQNLNADYLIIDFKQIYSK